LKPGWALLVLLAGCGSVAPNTQSDWERKNAGRLEAAAAESPALPPYPKKENLVEFNVSATADFKYFIDESTLSVAPKQRVVRYVIVARSPNGVENVRYEEIQCPDQQRVLALGRADGTWGGQRGEWREITRGTALRWHYALAKDYFCPHRDPIQTVAEGREALHNGIHPAVEVKRSMGGGE
jgi:hypothetical protein